MSSNVHPALGCVQLTDLIAAEGLPCESYKMSVSALSQSLAQNSAVIIRLPASDSSLLRSVLESARLFFNQRPYPAEMMPTSDTREWCRTSGYYTDAQIWQEIFDYRPGLTLTEPTNTMEFSPSGLPDMFSVLGKAARLILDAISFSLNLRSFSFAEILDNVPLRKCEISSSVLSVCCHSRPSFQVAEQHRLSAQDDSHLGMYSEPEHQVDKSLLTLFRADRPGLHVRDFHGRWMLMDGDLGLHDIVVYPGLALYQATAGYISPALHRTEGSTTQAHIRSRCFLAFKLMPKSMASLSCSEMRAAGYGVESQFQMPISVDDFMQRLHPTDQIVGRPSFQNCTLATQDGSLKPLLKRQKNLRCKPLPPSKRLRLEAQRVLKERVQDIADKKGIKLRFCNLKECECHIQSLESPCGSIRTEIGWPLGVPFVHPHDLPNKAKLSLLEAYEPGWTASQDIELSQFEPGLASPISFS